MARKTKKNSNIKTAYKFLAYPNSKQKEIFAKTFGCCRKLWNVMLDDHNFYYKQMGEYLYVTPADYKELDEYSYLNEVDSLALANVQMNLDLAFTNFFNKKSKYPKFKSKNKRQSYTTNYVNNNIRLEEVNNKTYIKLPKAGLVEINKHRNIKPGKIKNVTVSMETNGNYYISIMVETNISIPDKINVIQKDKINALDYKSDGLYQDKAGVCNMPKYYKDAQKKLKRQQRCLSKKQKGSNNYNKQKKKLSKCHKHIANQRLDFLHKDSTKITNLYDIVIVEDINLKTISSSKSKYKLGKATCDNGYGIYLSMLNYKLERKGGLLIKADKYFASSQTCSNCGYKNTEVKDLSIREWTCSECGTVHNRDENAVNNLYNYGIDYITNKLKLDIV